MAAKPIQISGVLFDKKNRTVQNVYFIGLASDPSLQIGGGPIIPPEGEKPPIPEDPPGIWQDPGGYNPNDPNNPWPPTEPPAEDRPKLIEWHVVWSEETGWQVIGVPNVPHPAPSGK